jgi:hypothetical protein
MSMDKTIETAALMQVRQSLSALALLIQTGHGDLPSRDDLGGLLDLLVDRLDNVLKGATE